MYLFRKGLSLFIAMVMLVAMVPAMTIGVAAQDATEEEQMKSIRQKLTTYFLERDTFDDGATAGKCYSSRAGEYFAIQQTDGSWADVDYYCTETAANGKTWEPYLALDRMQAMAMAYADPNGTWYHDAAMLQGVENAFSYGQASVMPIRKKTITKDPGRSTGGRTATVCSYVSVASAWY